MADDFLSKFGLVPVDQSAPSANAPSAPQQQGGMPTITVRPDASPDSGDDKGDVLSKFGLVPVQPERQQQGQQSPVPEPQRGEPGHPNFLQDLSNNIGSGGMAVPGLDPNGGTQDAGRIAGLFGRVLRDVTDTPAEGLAWLGDKLGLTGGMLPTQAQTRGQDAAALQNWNQGQGQNPVDEALRNIYGGAATIPLIETGTGVVGNAGRALGAAVPAIGAAGNAISGLPLAGYVGGIAKNALQGAAAAGLTAGASDQPFGQQLETGAALGGTLGAVFPPLAAAGRGLGKLVAPLTQGGREAMAGAKIAGNATDVAAARDALQNAPNGGQLVPGAVPTTGQLTGDQGLLQLERSMATRNPEAFLNRAGEQNAARVGALNNLAPESADPAAVGQAFRQQLEDLSIQGDKQVAQVRDAAQRATDSLGTYAPNAGDHGAVLQGFGQDIRSGLAASNSQAKQNESRLWKAIDPNNNLTVDMSPVRQRAQAIVQSMPQNAAPMSGAEQTIFGTAHMLPETQPFSELAALRSRITDASRQELMTNGRTQTYARLNGLLDSVHDAMAGGVAKQVATDAAGVQSGAVGPQQTVMGRLQKAANEPAGGPAGAATFGPGNVTGPVPGAAVAPSAAPTFDQAAAQRYQAARQATKQRAEIFREAPGVGQVLRTGQFASDYRLPDERVAGTIFNSGTEAGTRMQAFLRAGGDAPALSRSMQDYAAYDLRRAAEGPDGTLDPVKFARWQKAHAAAMAPFPELGQRFQSAATARAALDDATFQAASNVKAFQKSAAGKFLGDADPVAKVGRVLNADNAQAQMREIVALAEKGGKGAEEGLQRAVAEYLTSKFQSNKLAGGAGELKSDALQTFIKKAEPALSEVFTGDQMDGIKAVAADLQRSARTYQGTKLPGGSNTPQDLAAAAKQGHGNGLNIGQIAGLEMAQHAGEHLLGSVGGMIGMPAFMVTKMLRAAGLSKVQDLIAEAMLHPDVARRLLDRTATKGPGGSAILLPLARQIGLTYLREGQDVPKPGPNGGRGLLQQSSAAAPPGAGLLAQMSPAQAIDAGRMLARATAPAGPGMLAQPPQMAAMGGPQQMAMGGPRPPMMGMLGGGAPPVPAGIGGGAPIDPASQMIMNLTPRNTAFT